MLPSIDIFQAVYKIAYQTTGIKVNIIDPDIPIEDYGIVGLKVKRFQKKITTQLNTRLIYSFNEKYSLREIIESLIRVEITHIIRKVIGKYINSSNIYGFSLNFSLTDDLLISGDNLLYLQDDIIQIIAKEFVVTQIVDFFFEGNFTLVEIINIITKLIVIDFIDNAGKEFIDG